MTGATVWMWVAWVGTLAAVGGGVAFAGELLGAWLARRSMRRAKDHLDRMLGEKR
jgi:hypothetical protein